MTDDHKNVQASSCVCRFVQGTKRNKPLLLCNDSSVSAFDSADSQTNTQTHTCTLGCRHLLYASCPLTHATREPESVCRIPTRTWTRTRAHALAVLAGSFIGWNMKALCQISSYIQWFQLVLTRPCHLHHHHRDKLLVILSHHSARFTCVIWNQVGRVLNMWQTKLRSSACCQIRQIWPPGSKLSLHCQSSVQLMSHGMHMATHPVSHSLYVCCSATAFPSASPFFSK